MLVNINFPFDIQYKNYVLSSSFHFEEVTFVLKLI